MTPAQWGKRLARLGADYDHAVRAAAEEAAALQKLQEHSAAVLQAQEIIQHVAQTVQEQTHARLAGVVSRCLEAIYGEEAYEFEIVFERKRGKTEARLVFKRDGNEVDPATSSGGGCLEVAAFALRLAALVLERPARRRLLVLDEPFRCVHKARAEQLRELLLALSKEMGVQIIMVTHSSELECGTVYDLG